MTKIINELEPTVVWNYFEEICKIPRPSKKEEKIIKYLMDFAKKYKLQAKKDEIGNILISKPAVKGYENVKPVVLQSHLDMVGEKNSDTEHDFATDAIKPYIDGDWVKAKGTTLGADDGIGIATQMAILVADDIKHGPIECLFTVDEETGLSGAFALEDDFFESRTLINLDSEDWAELFIGCAGGRDTKAYFKFEKENVPKKSTAFEISVKGLKGGHSGDEIHKGFGNSIKLLDRLLFEAKDDFNIRISFIDGGNMRNAIPREAFAKVVVKEGKESEFIDYVNKFNSIAKNELFVTAPDLQIDVKKSNIPDFVIDKNTQDMLLKSLFICPHGEMAWSQNIPELVETSTNLATLKMDNEIIVGTSQRSSVESKLDWIVQMLSNTFELAGAEVETTDGYPGWQPNLKSEILEITKKSYIKLFKEEPAVKAIHAGLECGLIGKKYPGIDMISIGPDIKGAHTPDERINIINTKQFWDLLLDVLENMPKD
ncbi:MAG: aminoacyl-histidine dipeptidase [Bacteroidota bacterium]|nr:aminoacyl-histidine dipeptidase [Bacteroidota bacterium]